MLRSIVLFIVVTAIGWMSVACHTAQPPDPVTRAAFEGRTGDVLAALARGQGRGCDALAWAARGGQPRSIVAITAQGVNPDGCRVGTNNWTPLMHAIHKDQPAAVAALLQGGASANPPADGHGLTPLMMAVGNGNLAIVNLLLAAGADPHVTGPTGVNALTIAVSGGALMDIERPLLGSCHSEIVQALRRHAPDLRLEPSLRTRIARRLARLNGCDEALALASR